MANAAAFLYNQGVLKVSTLVYGLLTGQITLMSAAQLAGAAATGVWTAAVTAFNAAWLANPIGLVIVAITGLIAAGAALYAWLNKDSEETKKLKSEQEELTKKTDNLTDAIKQNAQARKQAIENTDKESVSYKKLADEVVNLASKEMKTAAEKKNLQKKIETLNGAMEGLNLAYDKNTGSLSHNTAQRPAVGLHHRLCPLQPPGSAAGRNPADRRRHHRHPDRRRLCRAMHAAGHHRWLPLRDRRR